jgi:hypothetical protein
MKRLAVLGLCLFLLTQVYAVGPVGEYLGFQLNRQAAFSGWFRESLHMTLPLQFDTVISSINQDTVTLAAELPYHSLPGYLFRTASWVNGSLTASYDTAYESAGVSLRQKQLVGDTVAVFVERYRVPFALDSAWPAGLAGTYPIDFGHNDTIDTVTIWADTSRVIGQEDVVTPYGLVPQCWKIQTTSQWCVVTPVSGIWTRDSMTLTTVQWYKDLLWMVRDSSYNEGRFRARIIIWLPAGVHYGWTVRELLALGVAGIAAGPPNRTRWREFEVSPNPFRSQCVIRCPRAEDRDSPYLYARLEIVDAAGRRVSSTRISDRLEWTPGTAPAGVYLLLLRRGQSTRTLGRVVYAP